METSNLNDLYSGIVSDEPKITPPPPKELVEFRELSKYEQSKDSEKFFSQEFIEEYLDKKWKAELFNRDTFIWLWKILQEEKDEIRQKTIKNRLRVFEKAIITQYKPFAALIIDLKGYKYGGIDPKEIEWDE